ncbi:Zinc finger protein 862-like 2, partial [Homarus americanus]
VNFVAVKNIERGDAASIKKCVCFTMNSCYGETWKQKLVGIGKDGASVMTGCRNGLVARLRRDLEKPKLEGIHCTAHKIELAYKDVQLAKKVDLLLLGIYLFYEKSSLNRSMLKHAHDICQVPFLVPTRVGGTRWLLHMLQALEHLLKRPNLKKIMEGDTTLFQGEKLSGRSNTFKTARCDMMTSLNSSLNKRFIEMASTILQNAWILNLKLWPAEYSGNKDFGDSAVQLLVQALEKTLMEAESKTPLVSRLSWQQINQPYGERCASFLHLVDLLLSFPASSADAERGFSQVKLIKTDWRSRLTYDHLTDLMVVQLQTESVGIFNLYKSIARFLTTGARRVDGYTHTAGCSTVEDLDDNNELNEEHVQEMLVQMQ